MRNPKVLRRCAIAAAALLTWPLLAAQGEKSCLNQVVEIRSYNLKPGTPPSSYALTTRLFEGSVDPELPDARILHFAAPPLGLVVIVERPPVVFDQ